MSTLPARQMEILACAARGLLDREIAGEIGLAAQTVRHHLQAVRTKLKARNTTHAVVLALRANILTLEDIDEQAGIHEVVLSFPDSPHPDRGAG
ncbi:partial Response regulator protein VraR, partial [Anaerolineae bacterium]